MISSVHTAEMIEFADKKKEKKLKPKVVHDNKNTMGGVDKVDQHLTDYPVARKQKHIPPTGKKSTPTRQRLKCLRKTDEKGKRIRRETRVYCKECDIGLCAVPGFTIYHPVKDL
ncbi:piggyBac transposable element-derived protein 4 [Trichonephila clavipes]|nr:piggyBac transposable element-derived protein 4 [Trichonephila clavipes]